MNNLPFLITISRNIKFGRVECLPSRKQEDIFAGIQNVIKLYNKRGFHITTVLADPEFESHKSDLHDKYNISLNVASAGEHVPEVERFICTTKESPMELFTFWSQDAEINYG